MTNNTTMKPSRLISTLLILNNLFAGAQQCGTQAGGAICPSNFCCSQYGWCGTTDACEYHVSSRLSLCSMRCHALISSFANANTPKFQTAAQDVRAVHAPPLSFRGQPTTSITAGVRGWAPILNVACLVLVDLLLRSVCVFTF